VDIYGVPFSLIPFKGRPTGRVQDDRPLNHVHALPERARFEIRFPVVEGYTIALKVNAIRADVAAIEPLRIEPEYEPTAVYVKPRVGYQLGQPTAAGPGEWVEHNRDVYYASTHLQKIEFELAAQLVERYAGDTSTSPDSTAVKRYVARHQLFPQMYRIVHQYVSTKIDFRGVDPRELGLKKYFDRVRERLAAAIQPDETQGELPLLPLLNRYKKEGTSAEVNFKTVRHCWATERSHINQMPTDTTTWESAVHTRLEHDPHVECYVRNEGLGFTIPYEFQDQNLFYEPDFIVRLVDGRLLVLEVKGYETEETRAKHQAARRWCDAVNHWGQMGRWEFAVCRDPQGLEILLKSI